MKMNTRIFVAIVASAILVVGGAVLLPEFSISGTVFACDFTVGGAGTGGGSGGIGLGGGDTSGFTGGIGQGCGGFGSGGGGCGGGYGFKGEEHNVGGGGVNC
jgi:hypothetical protein